MGYGGKEEEMSKRTRSELSVAMLIFLWWMASTTNAVIRHVPSQYSTIQAAISASNNGDTVLVAEGTHTGSGNRDIDFLGKAITVRSTDPCDPSIVAATIIDCNGTAEDPHRGFSFHSGEGLDSVVQGMTIRNGYGPEEFGTDALSCGGGIFCLESSPTISACIFEDNIADNDAVRVAPGGGIYLRNSSANIVDCNFVNNYAESGGAIQVSASSAPTISNCDIIGNSTEFYGAGICTRGNSVISHCVIMHNSAGNYGGGIYGGHGNQKINNCLISGNSADEFGGGISYSSSTLTIKNCTITGNSANILGGGVNLYSDCSAIISNCILWDNNADNGSEISIRYPHSPSDITVKYSDVQSGENTIYVAENSTLEWGPGNIDTDPFFLNPDNNDYHLLPDSNCINAGDPNYIAAPNETDLDGFPRVICDRIDMGVYEFHGLPILFVDADATGANDGSSWADAYNYVQYALAGAQAGDEIRVAQGTYIGLYFQLINGVTIKGGYAGVGEPNPNARDVEQFETILKGDPDIDDGTNFANYSENSPYVHVIIGSWTDWTAVLDGFTITGGYSEGIGGGMYNKGGTPTLIYCKFIRNYATNGGGAIANYDTEIYPTLGGPTLIHCTFIENSTNNSGGAIYNNEASPILINCTFIRNSAYRNGGGIYSDGSPSLTNCKFIGNSAQGHENYDGIWHDGHGGAIYHACCGNLKLNKCTFIANSGISGGAMYFRYDSSPKMSECMFIGNLAKNYGGAIYIQDFIHPNLNQCTFADNSAANGNALAGIPSSRTYGRPFILKITNSILWDGGDEIWNDDESKIEITYSDVEGGWLGEGNIDADPCFVDPGYWDINGTPDDANDDVWVDGDYHLLTRSHCINAGDPNYIAGPNAGDPNYIAGPNETDLDGIPRVIYGRIDMGAYEFQGFRLLFVDDDATGNNDGRSWADAYNYLQDALAACSSGDEIRVAQGIYKPDQGAGVTPGDREATFQLINAVTLKGGYAGYGESEPDARDTVAYETILSGDLDANDIDVEDPCDLLYEPTRAENSYHVVTGSNTDSNTVLDGFTITGGNANNSSRYIDRAGGMYIRNGSSTVTNCTFIGNSAHRWGGGMCCYEGGRARIINCLFTENSASWGGGICIYRENETSLMNCMFNGNFASNDGGGIYNRSSSSPTLSNCVVVGNSADNGGGMYNRYGVEAELTNCTFVDNQASWGGGIGTESTSDLFLINCLLWYNTAGAGSQVAFGLRSNLYISYSDLQWGVSDIYLEDGSINWGQGNIDTDPLLELDGYRLLPDSPCIDAGDPDYVSGPNETDLDGKPRIIGCQIDMGAYEYGQLIPAEARITPRTINLASKGNWITCYIWLPDQYNVADIDPNSIFLKCEIEPDFLHIDEQGQIVTARFTRKNVQPILEVADIELTITGKLTDGTVFEATDTIKVTDKGDKK
jgi:predicted outer membrane repeat protein